MSPEPTAGHAGTTEVERIDHEWRSTRAGFLLAWGPRDGIIPTVAGGVAVAAVGSCLGAAWAWWLTGDPGAPWWLAVFVGLVVVLAAVSAGARQVGRAWAYRAAETAYHRKRLEAVRREATQPPG